MYACIFKATSRIMEVKHCIVYDLKFAVTSIYTLLDTIKTCT